MIVKQKQLESFNVNGGERQGNALKSHFNLVLHYIIKKLDIRGTLSTKMVQNNAYADDVGKISRNLKAMEEVLQELGTTAQATGLIINQEKTKYIREYTISVSR